jgi:HD-GYP domain-containing protein (c-di-GMP phosphodiesterase class II)
MANGYPFGLKAGEIPPGAKIVSIADCFDAVTTDRPYQQGQSIASAFEILREGCRRFFCEEYVEVIYRRDRRKRHHSKHRPRPAWRMIWFGRPLDVPP